MILDTDFMIDLMDKQPIAVNKLQECLTLDEPIYTTSLTIFELFTGVFRSNRSMEEKEKVTRILQGKPVFHLDAKAGEKAGEWHGTLMKQGEMINVIDTLIAGIALTKKDKVLTRNIKDFSKIKGLRVETY